MSAPPYMKLYVADYLGDTHHLGALEHGAYLLLLMAMWRAGGSLPSADANLSRLARCTPDQWAEIRDLILPFFRRRGGRITHKRLSEEMAKYENTSGKRSEAGKKGAAEKANKNNAEVLAIASDAASNCRHNQNQNQKEEYNPPKPPQGGKQGALPLGQDRPARPRRKPNVSIPQGFPGPEDLAAAQRRVDEAGATVRVAYQAERFRNWAEGRDAKYADWPATWRNWIARCIEDVKPSAASADRTSTWTDAEWRTALRLRRENGDWSDTLGPPPGQPGCRVPAHLLIQPAQTGAAS